MTDESLFAAALALPHADRPAFLLANCPDPATRREVEDLLAAHVQSNPLDRTADYSDRTGDYHPDTADAPTASVGDRIGPYKLLERIGEGGMGEVWVADQLEPIKRRVAVKLIKAGMDSRSVLARFEAERQALAVMDHPNIAKVLDAGTTADGRPYFVMELVKGTPITEFADARKLTTKQRLELFVPVCQAIQHAHMKGIIHRDIKPGNVLVALHDETPVPKVIDFGVAKAVGQQLTEKTIYTGFGALVGTPTYMAPEQATFNQLDIDTRADVYALGVLLYELLAGSPPIEKERLKKAALDEVLRIVRDEEPPRPSARLSTSQAKASIAATRGSEPAKLSALMKGELDWIVMKALEKDRTRRYETANGFAADVQRYLSGEPVQAVPPSLGYRLAKAYRRNKAAVLAVGVVSLALLLGFAGTTGGMVWALDAEGKAKAARDAAVKAEGEAAANAETARAEAEKVRVEQDRTRRLFHASEMNHAFLDALEFRTGRLTERLEAIRPKPGETDIRGWEWHYLDRQAHSWTSEVKLDVATLPESDKLFAQKGELQDPSSPPTCFFSADGSRLVFSPIPKTTNPEEAAIPGAVFDVQSGKLLHRIPVVRVATAGTALLVAPGGPQGYFPKSEVAFSPDATWMAFSEQVDKMVRVRLVELASGKQQDIDLVDTQAATHLRVGLGGQRVTAAWVEREKSQDGFPAPITAIRLTVWVQGKAVETTNIVGPRDGLALVGYDLSPDGSALVLARQPALPPGKPVPQNTLRETTLEFVDLSVSPPVYAKPQIIQSYPFPRIKFSAGGRTCRLFEGERTAALYQLPSGKKLGQMTFGTDNGFAWGWGTPSDDGSRLLTPSLQLEAVSIARVPPPGSRVGPESVPIRTKPVPQPRSGGPRTALTHLSADGSRLLVASSDGTIQAWDLPQSPGYATTWPKELTVNDVPCAADRDPSSPWVLYRPPLLVGDMNRLTDKSIQPCPVALYDPARGLVVRRATVDMDSTTIRNPIVSKDGRRLLIEGPASPASPPPTDEIVGTVGKNGSVSTAGFSLWALDGPDAAAAKRVVHFDVVKCRKSSSLNWSWEPAFYPFLTPDNRFLLEPVVEPEVKPGPLKEPVADSEVRGYRVRNASDGQINYTIKCPAGENVWFQPMLAAGGSRFVLITGKGLRAEMGNRQDLTIRGFDTSNGESVWEYAVPAPLANTLGKTDPRCGYDLSADGSRLALAPGGVISDPRVYLLETDHGKLERELHALGPWNSDYMRVTLGPAGQVALGYMKECLVWDAKSVEPIVRLKGFTWLLDRPAFSADGRRLFTIDNNGNAYEGRVVRVWCLDTGRELMWFPVPINPALSGPLMGGFGGLRTRGPKVKGDRLYLQTPDGVRVFDGTPLPEAKK